LDPSNPYSSDSSSIKCIWSIHQTIYF